MQLDLQTRAVAQLVALGGGVWSGRSDSCDGMQGPQAVFHQDTAAQPGYCQIAEGRLFGGCAGGCDGYRCSNTSMNLGQQPEAVAVAVAVVHSAASRGRASVTA